MEWNSCILTSERNIKTSENKKKKMIIASVLNEYGETF